MVSMGAFCAIAVTLNPANASAMGESRKVFFMS
jgi:hypothetical protein